MSIFNIPLARFIIVVVAVFFIFQAIYFFILRKKSFSIFKLITTIIIWSGIGIIALFPDFAYFVSKSLGFGENLNTLIFVGFIIVFAILFKILRLIEKIEREISEIVRKEALKDVNIKHKT